MMNPKAKVLSDDKYFPYFVVDNFTNSSDFETLKKQFNILISRINDWNKQYSIQLSDKKTLDVPILFSGGKDFNDSFDNILNLSDDLITLKKFLLNLKKEETYAPFYKLDKKIKIFKLDERISLIDYITKINVRVSIKVSRVPSGSGIAIHRDSKEKIISMLFYLGFSDNIDREFGGTQIYNLNHEGQKENINSSNVNGIDHYYFSHKNFNKLLDIKPCANRLFGFVRNENSWHGIEPFEIKNKKDVFRDTLQINLIKHQNYNLPLKILKLIKNTLQNLF